MDIVLFEPDQPQNTGTLLRLGACMGMPVHVIEPCGFPFSPKAVKRYAMDYADQVQIHHHLSWEHFTDWQQSTGRRLVLLTTKTPCIYTSFKFQRDDLLMVGSESRGVPALIQDQIKDQITIPMHASTRSLNVAVAAAMVTGEALRQTSGWP